MMVKTYEAEVRPGVLPVGGEVSDQLWQRVSEGQPMALTLHGKPVAVVLDWASWEEIEAIAAGE